jgi:DNA-binding response OmpR family regulator
MGRVHRVSRAPIRPARDQQTREGRKPREARPKGRRKRRDAGRRIAVTVGAMRLLVVEDDTDLATALAAGLARAGYAVDVANTGADALEKATFTAYDLMVLDVNLPDTDGFAVCRTVRRGAALRVLMLTARSGLPDRIRGLDEGADDYLVKPFALAELLARIRALLRREVTGGSAVWEVGDLVLDDARNRARRGGRELPLTRKEFAVLRYLMSRPGHVVSAEELLDHVWDENADPFTQTVRVTVGTLRRKLTVADEPPVLETVIGRGYRIRETETAEPGTTLAPGSGPPSRSPVREPA